MLVKSHVTLENALFRVEHPRENFITDLCHQFWRENVDAEDKCKFTLISLFSHYIFHSRLICV